MLGKDHRSNPNGRKTVQRQSRSLGSDRESNRSICGTRRCRLGIDDRDCSMVRVGDREALEQGKAVEVLAEEDNKADKVNWA